MDEWMMLATIGWSVTGDSPQWCAAYVLCAAQVAWLSRQIGAFRWFVALHYSAPLIFFIQFVPSVLRSGNQVTWKGRNIRAD